MFEDIKDEYVIKEEIDFQERAQEYFLQYQNMLNKYQFLLLKQSQVNIYYVFYLTLIS